MPETGQITACIKDSGKVLAFSGSVGNQAGSRERPTTGFAPGGASASNPFSSLARFKKCSFIGEVPGA
jgi:hypothetical protein